MRIKFLFECFEDNFVVFNCHGNIKDVDIFSRSEKIHLKVEAALRSCLKLFQRSVCCADVCLSLLIQIPVPLSMRRW